MAIKTQNLGPGTLTLGAGPLAVQSQLTACKVVPAETVAGGDDAVDVLSGEQIAATPGTASYTATLEGTFLQRLDVGQVIDWSWVNRGTDQAVTFTPDTVGGGVVTGTIIPVPLQIGGDEVKKRMSSDFTWRFKAFPTFTPKA